MFVCDECGSFFTLSKSELRRYRGMTPRQCPICKARATPGSAATQQLVMAGLIDRVTASPESGIFTSGFCRPNPGPGGWAAVRVLADQVVDERHAMDEQSTAYRMELRALLEAYQMARRDETVSIYSTSEFGVNVVTKWAADWERNGWRNTNGSVKNVDLVKQLLAMSRARPMVRVKWIHDGTSKWSDYAASLAHRPDDSPLAS
jgi:ribonuclease HI